MLATKISFINEMANLCEGLGGDMKDLAGASASNSRIGFEFLFAGLGYGGSCFPKDTLALLRTADEFGIKQRIVSTVVEVNDRRKKAMADRVVQAMGGNVQGKRIGVLGLTFKPNTDDMRDAPSIPLIEGLQAAGANVVAFDPVGQEQAEPLLQGVEFRVRLREPPTARTLW